MIENERQFWLTMELARDFKSHLDRLKGHAIRPMAHPKILAAQIEAATSILAELNQDLADYDRNVRSKR